MTSSYAESSATAPSPSPPARTTPRSARPPWSIAPLAAGRHNGSRISPSSRPGPGSSTWPSSSTCSRAPSLAGVSTSCQQRPRAGHMLRTRKSGPTSTPTSVPPTAVEQNPAAAAAVGRGRARRSGSRLTPRLDRCKPPPKPLLVRQPAEVQKVPPRRRRRGQTITVTPGRAQARRGAVGENPSAPCRNRGARSGQHRCPDHRVRR